MSGPLAIIQRGKNGCRNGMQQKTKVEKSSFKRQNSLDEKRGSQGRKRISKVGNEVFLEKEWWKKVGARFLADPKGGGT